MQKLLSNRKTQQEVVAWAVVFALALYIIVSANLSTFNLIQFTLSGILVGGIYALVALGIVVINKATGIFNFAHGMMMLFGGLVFWQTFHTIPSTQFSLLLAVASTLSILMLFTENINAGISPPNEGRLARWVRVGSSQQFLLILGAGLVSGVVVYALLQNLGHDILRGALGGFVGSLFLGLVVDRFTIRPLFGQPVLASIMMTLAVALMLQGVISLIWGSQPRALAIFVEARENNMMQVGTDANGEPIMIPNPSPPKPLPNYRLDTTELLGKDLQFPRNLVWGFGIALACFVLFTLFFQFTSIGLAMRAVAENQTLAESVGLRVRNILAVAWALATTMAMIAAVIQGMGPGVGLSVLVIPPLAFRAFPAVLLGGLESITGALVGGLIIGVVEGLATATIDSSTGQEFAPFAVLMIVLLIRPDGLFGQRRIDRV